MYPLAPNAYLTMCAVVCGFISPRGKFVLSQAQRVYLFRHAFLSAGLLSDDHAREVNVSVERPPSVCLGIYAILN